MANVSVPVCPKPMAATSNGVFQGDNPLEYALPLAILQICIVLVLTRSIAFALKPLRQPRVIAEIIGGILLGPSALGRSHVFLQTVFPKTSLTVLDTLANLGLLFFLFLIGLELNPSAIRRTGKKALLIAVAGISLPFVLGVGTSFVLRKTISKGVSGLSFIVFMGVALSITAFPVLARILAELKLLTTDVGRMAMSAAAVNDVVAWVLLALAIAVSGSGHSPLIALWVLLCGIGFILFCVFLVKPVLAWMARLTRPGEPVKEIYVCSTLAIVLAASFATDAIGIHALFGAFIIGIVTPKDGYFVEALVEKVEDLVSGLFLPLYFVSSGLKTDITTIQGAQSWGILFLVIATACVGKIVGTFAVSLACKVPVREALTLAFLMNTKGLVELIVLNIGKDRKVLNEQTFAVLVLMAIFTTFMATPLVTLVYKPARRPKGRYNHRSVQRTDTESQLRMLACFHGTHNVSTIINLIEASRGSNRRDSLSVYAMHLMELSERPSAILMAHKARKNGLPFWNRNMRGSDQVVVAFESFERLSRVSVKPMTAISALATMHEDICVSAEQKRASIIILPFHKQQQFDGSLEVTGYEFQLVNRKVLESAPCSVAILVDRGLGGTSHVSASDVSSKITVLFFGGPDDCEALAYGARMAEHPGIELKVVCFREHANGADGTVGESFLDEFRKKADKAGDITFEDRFVATQEELCSVIQSENQCDLFLVGRRSEGAVAAFLSTERNDSPELGPVGCLMTSSNFATRASLLVLQKYSEHGKSAVSEKNNAQA